MLVDSPLAPSTLGVGERDGWVAASAALIPTDAPTASALRRELRRCSVLVSRLELHAAALTSAAAARWAAVPPPHAQSEAEQQRCMRQQMRTLAVMCTCDLPFRAWRRVCDYRRAARLAARRSEAVAAMRRTRLRESVHADMLVRIAKQDSTLRSLAIRSRLRHAVARWRRAGRTVASSRLALRSLRRRWLGHWREAARTKS